MDYKRTVQTYMEALWDLIYPSGLNCIICKLPISENTPLGICNSCDGQLTYVGPRRWIQSSHVHGEESLRMFSVLEYRGDIVKLIFRLKYGRETYLARTFAKMMKNFIIRENLQFDMMIPVPLHTKRLQQRGFNQAALLVKYLHKETSRAYQLKNLARVKNTMVMHQLTKQERRRNVTNAFVLKNEQVVKGLDILLVDDVLTTGSTVEACGRILLEAGAKSVTVLTLARSLRKKNES